MNWALKHWKLRKVRNNTRNELHRLSDKELMDLGIIRFNIETVVKQITIKDM